MSEKEYEDQIEGRNSVLELLESGKDINKIFIQIGEKHGSINKIIAKAKENKVIIVQTDKLKLDQMSQTKNHQGVIAAVRLVSVRTRDRALERITGESFEHGASASRSSKA